MILKKNVGTTDCADSTDSQGDMTNAPFTRQVNVPAGGPLVISAPIRVIRDFQPRF